MFSRLRLAAAGTAAAAVVVKASLITAADDWDDVWHTTKQLPSRALAAVGAPSSPPPRKPRVVVLGSGWGALTFIRKLDQSAVDLTIVSPRSFFFYTPLLAGTAVGTVSSKSIVEPIRRFCERVGHGGAAFIQAEVSAIDPTTKRVTCDIATPSAASLAPSTPTSMNLDYDYLVIAVGAEPVTFNIPGVREHARFLKEVEDGAAIQRDILQKLELASSLQSASLSAPPEARAGIDAEILRLLSWVVIGGGPTGVELCAELTDFVRSDVTRFFPSLAPLVRITLVEAADRVLGVFDARLSATAAATLTRLGAHVECNTAVTRITPTAVEFRRTKGDRSTGALHSGTVVWAGGVARRPIVEAFAKRLDPSGLEQTSRHGLLVDGWFRVKGVTDHSVYALGDCAVSGCAPTAQAATQQGRYLGRAFRDSLDAIGGMDDPSSGLPPFTFTPRGSLAYTGDGTAVAELRAILWDARPAVGGGGPSGEARHVEGAPAFALWRSLYFSSILSTSNQASVLLDWLKAAVFGRDISTPK